MASRTGNNSLQHEYPPSKLTRMGRQKNAAKARAKNFRKPEAEPPQPQIDESGSESSSDGDFVPEMDTDTDTESETEEDDEFFGEVKTDADYLNFSSALIKAQEEEVAREKARQRKRKKHYTGNSARSQRRHREYGLKMQRGGFRSVAAFFKSTQQPASALTPVSLSFFSRTCQIN